VLGAGGRDHTPSRVPQRTPSCREAAPLTSSLTVLGGLGWDLWQAVVDLLGDPVANVRLRACMLLPALKGTVRAINQT
jgi:hypothetical protein